VAKAPGLEKRKKIGKKIQAEVIRVEFFFVF
jgi:hypothetical protein